MLYYETIDDLSLYRYRKIIDTGDASYLKRFRWLYATPAKLQKIWANISHDVMDLNGVTDTYQKWNILNGDLERLHLDYMITRDPLLITLINIKLEEINKFYERINKGKVSLEDQIAAVEYQYRLQIDEHKTTVKRFYTYIKQITKNGKRENRI